MNTNDTLTAALAYAGAGLAVFPCGQDKRPRVKWKDDATTDEATVSRWWRDWPDAMIGLPTGSATGLYVVDLDTDKETGEAIGEQSITRLGLKPDLRGAPSALTPSGGRHFYFRHPGEGWGNTAGKIGPGIDTRGAGGYVIAPGSMNGTGAYTWTGPSILDRPLPDLPETIRAAVTAQEQRQQHGAGTGSSNTSTWAERALAGELARVAAAHHGQRNVTLNRAAFALGQIIGGGHLDRQRVEAALLGVATGIGLDAAEARATIESGLGAGEAEPRGPKDGDRGHHNGGGGFEAADPIPLVRATPPAAPYPLSALGPLRPAADAICDVTQAPAAIAAHAVLGVASLAAQGLADAETLHGAAPASLYLLTLAQSGERKSACDKLAMRPVRAFEDELAEGYREAMAAYRDRLDIWTEARKAILRTAKDDRDGARADLAKLGPEPEPPLAPSITSPDPTLEGITKNMPRLRASLGVFADEGGAFIGGHGMTQENRLRTIAGHSGLWDGTPVARWRAGDGVSRFRGRRLAMHLMCQPVAAEGLLADPLAQGQGFLARFLMVEPDSAIGTRLRAGHAAASDHALDRFTVHIGDMLRAPLPLREGTRNELDPPMMRLDPAAREALQAFALLVEKAQAPGARFEAVRPFASKAAEHAARLAAVLALYRDPDGRAVTAEDMANGIELVGFYLQEAARLADAAVIGKATADAERMRRWLLESWGETFISATDAAQRGPFKETARVRATFRMLVDYRWLTACPAGVEILGKHRREAWRVNREGR